MPVCPMSQSHTHIALHSQHCRVPMQFFYIISSVVAQQIEAHVGRPQMNGVAVSSLLLLRLCHGIPRQRDSAVRGSAGQPRVPGPGCCLAFLLCRLVICACLLPASCVSVCVASRARRRRGTERGCRARITSFITFPYPLALPAPPGPDLIQGFSF